MDGNRIQGWHWTAGPLPGVLRDGRPVVIGEVLRHDGPLVMCERGLHLSERALDALQYAPGSIVHRVEGSGEILRDADRLDCRERTALWSLNAETILRDCARRWALDVAHLWPCPEIVRRYLETGEESIRDAARAAAWAAARDADWDAAWSAAWSAAWAAAWAAARDAAWSAAWAAARDADWDAQNAHLEAAIFAAHESAQ